MTPIPAKLKKEILEDPNYKSCMLHGQKDHYCDGRITLEHAMTFGGNQIQEKWAILSICARGHEVDQYQDAHTMVKEMHVWVALNRAPEDRLKAISKAENYSYTRDRLNRKYGVWQQKFPVDPYFHEKTEKLHVDLKASPKTFWYPVGDENLKKLSKIQEAYDTIGHTLSLFQIIDRLIDCEHETMEKYKKTEDYQKRLGKI